MVSPGNPEERLLSRWDTRAHQFDGDYSAYNGYEGGKFAKPIKRWLGEHNVSFPKEPQLLGLGAGVGNPECALAEQLGIGNEEIGYKNVTLVDKNPTIAEHPILTKYRKGIRYLAGRGIFYYLENPDRRDFSVVTAIGLEYLVNSPDVMRDFVQVLPNVLLPNAFVCIYPDSFQKDGSFNPERVWSENGFEKVTDLGPDRDYWGSLMYVYTNPPKE